MTSGNITISDDRHKIFKEFIVSIISPCKNKDEISSLVEVLSSIGLVALPPVITHTLDRKEYEEVLMSLHKVRIGMSDICIVLTTGGYMGRGTFEEIGFATVNNKHIVYLDVAPNLPMEECFKRLLFSLEKEIQVV